MKTAIYSFSGTATELLTHLQDMHFGVNPENGQWEYLGKNYIHPDYIEYRSSTGKFLGYAKDFYTIIMF